MNQKTTDIFELPTHPAADVFPMLPDDELEELAQDIAANGLQQPLVVADVDGETVLVDGRNRREACRRVEIEPRVTELNGQDPTAYILSANINRRHLSKGQRAIAVALIFPKGGRGKTPNNLEFSAEFIRMARIVLNHAPDFADAVLNGSISLDAAYKQACQRKQEAESNEAIFNRLKKEAPDFADRVTEEQMTIGEALAALEQRKKERRQAQMCIADSIGNLTGYSSTAATENARQEIVKFMLNDTEIFEEFSHRKIGDAISGLRRTGENCTELATLLEKEYGK